MKILIVSNTFPPEGTATAGLIANICENMLIKGIQIDALTTSKQVKASSAYNGISVFYTDSTIEKKESRKNLITAIINKIQKTCFPSQPVLYKESTVNEILKMLIELKAHTYDYVIAVCAYYEMAEAALRYKKRISDELKLILYQVDPLAENLAYASIDSTWLIEYEKNLFMQCELVFTTPIIYEQKKKQGWDTRHIIPVEFPAVVPKDEIIPVMRLRDEIRCVFAGYLYKKIRNPQYTLQLFSMLDSKIHLYILGTGNDKLLKKYADGPMKGRLHCMGALSPEICDQWLSSADVLVNIGNSVLNQVPSKLFHYISFGKSILNICKSSECATRPYMAKYPMGYELIEGKQIDQKTILDVERWIFEHAKEQVDFSVISKIYASSTPAYVVDQMLSSMKKVN